MMEFGEQLRRARETKGMTQKSLAEQLYVSRQSISNWECGERYPDIVTLKKISRILEVSLDNLLSGKEMVKVVEKKPVIENRIINSLIAALYAFIVLSLFLKIGEELTLRYFHAYERFFSDINFSSQVEIMHIGDKGTISEKVILMLIFSYGLYSVLRDRLTPKKIGIIMMAFFSTFLFYHAILPLVLNKGYSYEYEINVLENNEIFGYLELIFRNVILTSIFGFVGIIASYFCFVRDGRNKVWLYMIAFVSALGIINKCVKIFSRLKMEKFYVINISSATFEQAETSAKDIIEAAVFTIAIYVLFTYQAHVLYRKRQLARDLSDEQSQDTVVC